MRNLYMSSSCIGGSTGKRDIGFNAEQVKTILHNASLIKSKLAKQ